MLLDLKEGILPYITLHIFIIERPKGGSVWNPITSITYQLHDFG